MIFNTDNFITSLILSVLTVIFLLTILSIFITFSFLWFWVGLAIIWAINLTLIWMMNWS